MSLFEHFCEETRYSEATVCFYLEQVLQALQYMHSRKIVFLDLKPENVLLDTTENRVKLIDFGSSTDASNNGDSVDGRAIAEASEGSPEFLAPEIISNGPLGAYTDMWGFGVLLYVALRYRDRIGVRIALL